MLDRAVQLAYALGFRAMRVLWRLNPPRHTGALVALWHRGALLVVRTSYQPTWSLPGGGVGPGESAIGAASRELQEELGLRLPASTLRPALVTEHLWNGRHDRVHLFEAELDEAPALRPDGREVVEARFASPDELATLPLPPHVHDYLADRAVRLAEARAAQG